MINTSVFFARAMLKYERDKKTRFEAVRTSNLAKKQIFEFF